MFKSTATIAVLALTALTTSGQLGFAQDKQKECLERANNLCNDIPAGTPGHTNCVNIEFQICMNE